ncbi:MAG: Gfo/Idh/MocA family oxidoreductase [bacterium]|nr:Gfo/Idh/MocA family oxidoreductase [bacterium]
MSDRFTLSRRTFLQSSGSAAAFAAPLILSTRVFGANDIIGIGHIGVGRRAMGLVSDFSHTKGSQIVAISDVDRPRMDHVAKDKTWKKYPDFRQMLEDKDVDAVVIATPDHWHALHSIYACMAGKDVYVEKPMTLTIAEGRAMVTAARKYKCIVQCGSQQRSMEKCRIGCELVRNGKVGAIKVAHAANYHSPWDQPFPTQPVPEGLDWNAWLGPTPERGYHIDLYTPRANPGWISITPYSGGEVTGWGAHGLDMIQWALGMDHTGPVEIWPEGSFRDLNRIVNMKYANGTVIRTDGKGPDGGAVFDGEKGSILVDRGVYKVMPDELGQDPMSDPEQKLQVSHNHQQNWLDCIRSRELPIADVEIGHRASILCHMVNIARWTNRKMQWDPEKEIFVGDDNANTYLDRPRREPWGLPQL